MFNQNLEECPSIQIQSDLGDNNQIAKLNIKNHFTIIIFESCPIECWN